MDCATLLTSLFDVDIGTSLIGGLTTMNLEIVWLFFFGHDKDVVALQP